MEGVAQMGVQVVQDLIYNTGHMFGASVVYGLDIMWFVLGCPINKCYFQTRQKIYVVGEKELARKWAKLTRVKGPNITRVDK